MVQDYKGYTGKRKSPSSCIPNPLSNGCCQLHMYLCRDRLWAHMQGGGPVGTGLHPTLFTYCRVLEHFLCQFIQSCLNVHSDCWTLCPGQVLRDDPGQHLTVQMRPCGAQTGTGCEIVQVTNPLIFISMSFLCLQVVTSAGVGTDMCGHTGSELANIYLLLMMC